MYRLQVLTPKKVMFDDMVIALIAPGELGYFGVLTDHAPMITSLKSGIFIITDKNSTKEFFKISEGFFQVKHNAASLLIETFQPISPIDIVDEFLPEPD